MPISKFIIDITANSEDARRKLEGLQRNLGALNEVGEGAGLGTSSALAGIATAAGPAGIAVAGLGSAIAAAASYVNAFQELELGIARIRTIADKAAFSTSKITEDTQRLAGEFGGSAAQQAGALYQVISSGATSATDAIKTLEAANVLAVGSGTEISTVVDGLSVVLNSYNLSGEEAAAVTDKLAATLQFGRTSMQDLARSAGQVIPVSAALGISLDDTLGTIAALTKTTGTSESITQFRAALSAVLKPSAEAEAIMKKVNATLGDSAVEFNAAALKSKGILQFFQDLRDVVDDTELARVLGSNEAALAVIGITGERAAAASVAIDGVSKSAGQARRSLEEIDNTLAQQWNILGANISNANAAMGQFVAEGIYLEEILKGVNSLLGDGSWDAFKEDVINTSKAFSRDFSTASGYITEFALEVTGVADVTRGLHFVLGDGTWNRLTGEIDAATRSLAAYAGIKIPDRSQQSIVPLGTDGPVFQTFDSAPGTEDMRRIISERQAEIREAETQAAREREKLLKIQQRQVATELNTLADTYRTSYEKVRDTVEEQRKRLNEIESINPALSGQINDVRKRLAERLAAAKEAAAKEVALERNKGLQQLESIRAGLRSQVEVINEAEQKRLQIVNDNVKDLTKREELITRIVADAEQKRTAILQREEENRKRVVQEGISAVLRTQQLKIAVMAEGESKITAQIQQDYQERRAEILANEQLTADQRQELLVSAEARLNEALAERQQERINSTIETLATTAEYVGSLVNSALSIAQTISSAAITEDERRERSAIEVEKKLALNAAKSGKQRAKIKAQYDGQLAAVEEKFGKKRFEEQKKYSISAAIINTAVGVTQALSIGFPQGLAAAAIVAAAGLAQVTSIASSSYGGGSSVASVPDASAASATIDNALENDFSDLDDGEENQRDTRAETYIVLGSRAIDEVIDGIEDRIGSGRVLINPESEQARVLRAS